MAKWSLRELFWRNDDEHVAEAELSVVTQVQRKPLQVLATLSTLRDVQGVVGSLAIGIDGTVWGRDLPGTFDDDSTTRLAQRLAQLHEALTSEGDGFDAGALRYQAYRFHIARALPGLLGVLTEDQVNLPALTMAMKLVSRKLAGFVTGEALTPAARDGSVARGPGAQA